MLVTVQHQIGVDLVGDDLYPVADADITHGLQFFRGPDPAHGVVGVAEDEVLGVLGLLLKAAAREHEGEYHDCGIIVGVD